MEAVYTVCWYHNLPLGGYNLCHAQIVDQFCPNFSNADNTVLVNYSNSYYRTLLAIKYKLFTQCNSTKTDRLAFYSQLPCNSATVRGSGWVITSLDHLTWVGGWSVQVLWCLGAEHSSALCWGLCTEGNGIVSLSQTTAFRVRVWLCETSNGRKYIIYDYVHEAAISYFRSCNSYSWVRSWREDIDYTSISTNSWVQLYLCSLSIASTNLPFRECDLRHAQILWTAFSQLYWSTDEDIGDRYSPLYIKVTT